MASGAAHDPELTEPPPASGPPIDPEPGPHLALERSGTGRRVVLVHGFTQTGRSWQPIAERLRGTHEVITVDAPGHGRSTDIRADLVTGAELLGQAGGPASYVGYSMGGRLCLHLAVHHPHLVRQLVLVGTTAGLDDPAERAARRAADDRLADDLEVGGDTGLVGFLERWLSGPLFATLPRARAGMAARRENTAAGLSSSLRLAGTGAQEPLWDRLSDLAMPVLVVAGDTDARFMTMGRRLVQAIGSNARLVGVAHAGHAAHLEQPDAFLSSILPFLDGPTAPV